MTHLGKFKGHNASKPYNQPYIAPKFGVPQLVFVASVVFIAAFSFGSML